jgi:hypothetical protein
MMKKFILTMALSVAAMVAQAQTVQTWLINSNVVTNLVVSGGINVKTLTVSASGTGAGLVFYDYNTNGGLGLGTLQYSNTTAFSNLVTVDPYTNSVIFTNSLGNTQTNKYRGIYSYWTNVATATASNAQSIGSVALQSGVPYTVPVNWNLTKGLTVKGTNNANTVIILEYQ